MQIRIFLLVILSLALVSSAAAQPTSDLELQIVIDAPSVTPPGAMGQVSFVVTNHGPDDTGTAGDFNILVGSDELAFSFFAGELLDYVQVSPIENCRIISQITNPPPGSPPEMSNVIYFANIEAGSSRTCEAEFFVNPEAFQIDPEGTEDGDIDHWWLARTIPGVDINEDDNFVELTYHLTATSVPTMTPAGIIFLCAAIFFAYRSVIRRNRSS